METAKPRARKKSFAKNKFRKMKVREVLPLKNKYQFWMVVVIHENNILEAMFRPMMKHSSAQSAAKEAQRLAKKFKAEYAVMEVMGTVDKFGQPKG